jgi:hypothetical protein
MKRDFFSFKLVLIPRQPQQSSGGKEKTGDEYRL